MERPDHGKHQGGSSVVAEASKIREEIANGRAELANTVQALVEKADVKGRVRDAITDNTDQLHDKAAQTASQLTSIARDVSRSTSETRRNAAKSGTTRYVFGGLGLLVALLLVRRGRSQR
jgi:uncharacterized coiled-coil DUF342 family protein